MNRLVIVGNGFDLAHGLKTRYEDFLLDLFKKALQESATIRGYECDKRLFKITCHYPNDFYKNVETLENLFDDVNINNPKSRPPIITRSEPRRPYHITFQSDWFKELTTENNWVDIESAYFKELINQTIGKDKYNSQYIKNFHESFNVLTEMLRIYMEDVNSKLEGLNEFPKSKVIENCFKPVTDDNFEYFFSNTPSKNQLNKVVFLNFNYTKLLKLYLEKMGIPSSKYDILNIHGELKNENDIIFGYGDDTHPKYKELELLDDNEVLSKMKSFQYPTNKSYRHLINFIESDYFDVVVMGHSLGISDRVLLKTIFEIDFCKMITILHRSENKNDFRKWIPLSRHFDKKVEMRRKIKDFEDEDIM